MKVQFSRKIFLVLLVLSIPAFSTLLRRGYFPMHDDIQGMRLYEMGKCFFDGQIPCRWVPDMGLGYGYPQFNYYAPLPYYLVVPFVLLGASVLETIKLSFIVSAIGSSVGMYLLGSYFWGKRGGVLSSLFYVYAPYRALNMYVRGALGELWGMMFLPFVFYFALKVMERKKYILPLSLSVAGLLLSHNITTIVVLPFFVVFVLFSKKFRLRNFVNLGLAGFWGLGLSAFFVLPAFFEKQYVHVETILQGYFNYLAHFLSLNQVFLSTFWGYGVSLLGPLDGMSFAVGILHWTIPILTILILVYLKKIKKAKEVALFFILALLALFLTHNKSVFIWDSIPFLAYVQFPWRFLAIGTFFLALCAGALVYALPNTRNKRNILILSMFLVLILFYGSFFKPQRWIDISDAEKFSGESWTQQQTISIFDYLPIYANYPPSSRALSQPEILSVGGEVSGQKGTNWQDWKVNLDGNGHIRLQQFDFPGWEVRVDGEIVSIDNDNEFGLITISVPAGEHEVKARLRDTNLRRFANLFSASSLVLIPVFYKKFR